jgi:hypothetical protein
VINIVIINCFLNYLRLTVSFRDMKNSRASNRGDDFDNVYQV